MLAYVRRYASQLVAQNMDIVSRFKYSGYITKRFFLLLYRRIAALLSTEYQPVEKVTS